MGLEVIERQCYNCGRNFILSSSLQQELDRLEFDMRKIACPLCHKEERDRIRRVNAQKVEAAKQRQQQTEHTQFLEYLTEWPVVTLDSLCPPEGKTLYILGNGFDLMHRVPSSYYSFRDSLGKNSQLRIALEDYINVDDVWSDFENALAHFDIQGICNPLMADTSLDISGYFDDEDPGAAEYFMAVEQTVWPLQETVTELPSRFRKWVKTLSVGTADRPLKGLFRGGKVLSFNYTEFAEQLYDIPQEEICHIHGCRRNKKGHPNDTLVLGHIPNESDEAFDIDYQGEWMPRDRRKQVLIENVLDNALQLAYDCDEALTKDCQNIIEMHRDFFDSLKHIEEVVCIGHSFSPVDRPYFEEIIRSNLNPEKLFWDFGCYGLKDLVNLGSMISALGLKRDQVRIFRTDVIRTTPLSTYDDSKAHPAKPHSSVQERCIAYSDDGRWELRSVGRILQVFENKNQMTAYEIVLPEFIKSAYFLPSHDTLLIYTQNFELDSGLLLFRFADNKWRFVHELAGIPNQGLLNRRLNRIMLDGNEALFVFNNRIRRYSMETGCLLENRPVQDANSFTYQGKDILPFLVPK